MNKNILKAIIVGGFMLTSCNNDLLNPYTPGSLTEDVAITTINDLQLLLNASYAGINSRAQSEFVSIFTDEVGIGFANGGQGLSDDYIFQMTPDSGLPNAVWINNNITISRVNRIFDAAANIVPKTSGETATLNLILAQAYTIRAYCHLTILSYFTTDMTSDTALAGILADKTYNLQTANNQKRATNGEFYKFIHADLDKALVLYTASGSTGVVKTQANRFFALGLKARAYEYKGDYISAEPFADQVIAQSGLAVATTAADYQSVFFTDNEAVNLEVIFRLKRTPAQNVGQGFNLHNAWASIAPNLGGSPFYEVSRSLFNKLNVNTNDYRFRTIVAPSSIIDPSYASSLDYRNTDKLIINKHGGVATGSNTAATTSANTFTNDIKIMRLPEMYFIKAEARIKASDFIGATMAVNKVRTSRLATLSPNYATETAAWKGVLDERRLEYAFEGYRFIDLKRIGTKAASGIDRDPADYTSSSANYPGANPSNLPLTSFKFALPIPRAELNANNVITQNPGY